MLTINAASSQLKKTDEALIELKIDEMKYASFEDATSEERLAATHCDEMKNSKAQHETLINARKRQLIKINNENASVEQEA